MTQQQRERSAQMLAEIEDGCSVTAGSLDVESFYRKVEDTKAQATHKMKDERYDETYGITTPGAPYGKSLESPRPLNDSQDVITDQISE